ncbi:MAG: hypothetical protein LBL72_03145 [Candidatus Accumulibacter sp.]|nr:hypothetical protein [Accumulibacter sp.]
MYRLILEISFDIFPERHTLFCNLLRFDRRSTMSKIVRFIKEMWVCSLICLVGVIATKGHPGAIAIAIFFFVSELSFQAKCRKCAAALREREPLGDAEIYRRFYASSGLDEDLVFKVWHEIAEFLEVPAGSLRPTDVFGKDIGPDPPFCTLGHPDVEGLEWLLSDRAKSRGISPEGFRTVDDYVRISVALLKKG